MEEIIAYKCSYCGRIINSKENCIKHEKKCIKNTEQNCCNNCKKGTSTCYRNNIFVCDDKNILPDSKILLELSENFQKTLTHIKFDCQYFESKYKNKK